MAKLVDIINKMNRNAVMKAPIAGEGIVTEETTAGTIYSVIDDEESVSNEAGNTLLPLTITSKIDDSTQEYNCAVFANGYTVVATGSDKVRFPRVVTGIGVVLVAGMKVSGTKYGAEDFFTSFTPDVWQDGNDPF